MKYSRSEKEGENPLEVCREVGWWQDLHLAFVCSGVVHKFEEGCRKLVVLLTSTKIVLCKVGGGGFGRDSGDVGCGVWRGGLACLTSASQE